MDTSTLKFGSKVWYAGCAALVQRVATNGVYISFDGQGLRAGEYITRRVSAKDLSERYDTI